MQNLVTFTPVNASISCNTNQAMIRKSIPKRAQTTVCLADWMALASPPDVINLKPAITSTTSSAIKEKPTKRATILLNNFSNSGMPAGSIPLFYGVGPGIVKVPVISNPRNCPATLAIAKATASMANPTKA